MTRSAETEEIYKDYLSKKDPSICQFCNLESERIIKKYDHLFVIENIFPYELWDSCKVEEHYMLLPKRHIASKSEYTPEEKDEFMDIVSEYEGRGFSLYSRGNNSVMKSVMHQHSHLIKLDNSSRISYLFFNQDPYVRVFS